MRNLWFSLRESWIKRQNCIGDVGTSLRQYPQFIYLLFKSKKKRVQTLHILYCLHQSKEFKEKYISLKTSLQLQRKRVDKLVILGNDPTAGSPTVTLLRLLLPLNDQV